MASQGWTDKRPMSPHLQVWKFHPTMLASILQRAAGIANAVGLAMLIGWMFATATGLEAFEKYDVFFDGFIGQLFLFGCTVAVMFHFANGIRYLFWDAGKGFSLGTANFWSVFTIVFGVVGALGAWLAFGIVPFGS